MNPPRRRWPTSCGILGAALLAAACHTESPAVGGGTEEPQRGGTLVIGSTADVDSWNPYVSRQSFASDVLRRIFLPLAVEQPATGQRSEFAPRLAESWSASADGTALTFTLREATWSDGTPVTADDVRFTWTAQTSPDVPWIDAGRKERIRDVAVVDARTVRFDFDAPYPGQLADAVEGPILPRHRFSEVPFESWAQHPWTSIDVGSGPFLLERHDPGQEIVLRRNPLYPDGAWLDRVVVRVVPDMANLLTQLRAGEVDYVEGVPPREAAALAADPAIEVVAFDYPSYVYLGWNGAREPLDDPAVRRALTLAIDREALVEDLLYGYGRVSKGPVLSFWWADDGKLAPWPHDPDEARRMLRERGVRVDDGTSAGARPLDLTILINDAIALQRRVLVKIQQDLAQVGVAVTIRPMAMRAMRQRIASGEYDGYMGSWVYSVNDLASVFHSSALFPQGANLVSYVSPAADDALDRAAAAPDRQTMADALREFQRIVHADQPYTFLYESRRIAAHASRVRGMRIDTPSDPLAALEHAWVR